MMIIKRRLFVSPAFNTTHGFQQLSVIRRPLEHN